MAGLQEKLDELKQSLLDYDVALDVRLNGKLHDREVRLDNGWTIKIGVGWTSTRSLMAGSRSVRLI
jgi:ATP-dependent Lon protease